MSETSVKHLFQVWQRKGKLHITTPFFRWSSNPVCRYLASGCQEPYFLFLPDYTSFWRRQGQIPLTKTLFSASTLTSTGLTCPSLFNNKGHSNRIWYHFLIKKLKTRTLFLSSFRINLLAFYHGCHSLIGYATQWQLVNFDYQNINSLCSRHHYVNSSC